MQPPLGRRTRQVSFCRKPGACRLRTGLTLSAQPPIPPPSPRRTVRSSIASRNRECVPLHVNPASARRPSTGRVRRSPQGYLLTRPVLWKRRGVNQRGGSTETTHRVYPADCRRHGPLVDTLSIASFATGGFIYFLQQDFQEGLGMRIGPERWCPRRNQERS